MSSKFNKWAERCLERKNTQYASNKPTTTNLVSLERMENYMKHLKPDENKVVIRNVVVCSSYKGAAVV